MSRLRSFFIVGAPKAGTTSLYWYIDQHPQVYMSPIKEPNFFATEIRERNFDPKLRRAIARHSRGLREFLSGSMREKLPLAILPYWSHYLRRCANAAAECARGEPMADYL